MIPEKIRNYSKQIVCGSIKGGKPEGGWAPFVRGIQARLRIAYDLVGFWPEPVVLPVTDACDEILDLAVKEQFNREDAERYLGLINHLWNTLKMFDDKHTNWDFWEKPLPTIEKD